ncbi:MAG: EamA family transporter [Chloroflexi bacterium]|nr:EamA family transporter [Chloroflexota bacterium]MBI1856518.1 EamA family transporter [Chloroflexota bacterium]MBI3340080.1 EamA family transporter [Chloroflexota bacterium]
MPLAAIGLLFVSAVLHTTWNLLLKQAGEKYVAIWWGMLIGSSLFLPVLFFTGLPAWEIWRLLLISVVFEIVYYIALSAAYNDADFSLVYPMARGSAPAMIAVWSVLFLREKLTTGGVIGLVIIILGLLVVGGSSFFHKHSRPRLRGILFALLIAFSISIYSTIDGAAVKHTAPFPYAVLILFIAPALMTPFVIRRYGWAMLKDELVTHRLRLMVIGALSISAYLLALWAYSLAKVSYSGAVREVSVVMGAFAGWQFLGEKLGGMRVLGAAIIFSGILVIAIFG